MTTKQRSKENGSLVRRVACGPWIAVYLITQNNAAFDRLARRATSYN